MGELFKKLLAGWSLEELTLKMILEEQMDPEWKRDQHWGQLPREIDSILDALKIYATNTNPNTTMPASRALVAWVAGQADDNDAGWEDLKNFVRNQLATVDYDKKGGHFAFDRDFGFFTWTLSIGRVALHYKASVDWGATDWMEDGPSKQMRAFRAQVNVALFLSGYISI